MCSCKKNYNLKLSYAPRNQRLTGHESVTLILAEKYNRVRRSNQTFITCSGFMFFLSKRKMATPNRLPRSIFQMRRKWDHYPIEWTELDIKIQEPNSIVGIMAFLAEKITFR